MKEKEVMQHVFHETLDGVTFVRALGEELLVIDNLREVPDLPDLSKVRASYNSIVMCRRGHVLVEVGGNNQIKVSPNQMLLIPTGKLVQPMLVSTDLEASALLLSDRMLKALLGSQVNIWNKAMYLKEIYLVADAGWINTMQAYTRSIFHEEKSMPKLAHEIIFSLMRMLILMICESLLKHEEMTEGDNESTIHDKDIFNRFLYLIEHQEKKRQRVAYYADKLNITAKYLSSISKHVSGKSPIRWIMDGVMQDSYSLLLTTDLSVKEISHRLGFPNSSFFGQYFREQSGMTPMEFRNHHKG